MTGATGERLQRWGLMVPALGALAFVLVYPLLTSLWLSLHRFILVFDERKFVGVDQYAFLLTDARFWGALGNTVYFTAVALVLEVVIGLGLATLMNQPFRGQGLLRAAVLVPWAIPTVVSAKLWAWLFHPELGWLVPEGANWLGSPTQAMHAAITVDVWKTSPFVALLLLAGLQGISEDVYQAARLDGASALRIFRSITLPMLAPVLGVTALMRALDAFRVFDAIYVLTEGGPANTTETLSIYTYKTLMRAGDFGYGSTLAIATFVCAALLTALGVGLMNRRRR
ncbi:MAG: sugar ABC transporter permease [Myxococcota bacterium]|nr:sugar ABC transporter permease [Myxococcota bacterium]